MYQPPSESPAPERDLSEFKGWAVVFIILRSLGLIGLIITILEALNYQLLSLAAIVFICLICRIAMLVLLAKRSFWFRYFHYAEYALNIVLLFAVSGLVGNALGTSTVSSLVTDTLVLLYVIFSKRLRAITRQQTKYTPPKQTVPQNYSFLPPLPNLPPPEREAATAAAGTETAPTALLHTPKADAQQPALAPGDEALSAAPPPNAGAAGDSLPGSPPAAEAVLQPAAPATLLCPHCGSNMEASDIFCRFCGRKPSQGKKTAGTALVALLVISLLGNLFSGFYLKSQLDERDKLAIWAVEESTSLTAAQKSLSIANEQTQTLVANYNTHAVKADFLDENIAFILLDGDQLYHTITCEKMQNGDYGAIDIPLAVYEGYFPCPLCH